MHRYSRPVLPPPTYGPYGLGSHYHPYFHYGGSSFPSAPGHWPFFPSTHAVPPSHPASYPKPGPLLPPPRPSFLAQFKNSDGTYDINKMMSTVGQMINTVNQVNGVLKGLLGTFKK
ncbi:YppG family protein [Geobacillus vulcani]|uniref:YppG family protein n=1 Tax=Geobacillus vulcani TaxID=135517 RepID=UPI0004DF4529|nr:YppG family protein [Geobacillus vulcani]